MTVEPASAIPRKTATQIPKMICVTPIVDSPRRTQGVRITGCGASSTISPRCAASCCTHHWQIFLPKEKPGSCRPHRTQFAMNTKEYQQSSEFWEVDPGLGKSWPGSVGQVREGHGFSRAAQTGEEFGALAPEGRSCESMDSLRLPRHVIHQQVLPQRVRRREVGLSAAHLRDFLYELHQAII